MRYAAASVGLLVLCVACGGDAAPFIMARVGQQIAVPPQGLVLGIANPDSPIMEPGGAFPGDDIVLDLPGNTTSFSVEIDGAPQLTALAVAKINSGMSIDSDTYNLRLAFVIVYNDNKKKSAPVALAPNPKTLEYPAPQDLSIHIWPWWQSIVRLTAAVPKDLIFFRLRVTPN